MQKCTGKITNGTDNEWYVESKCGLSNITDHLKEMNQLIKNIVKLEEKTKPIGGAINILMPSNKNTRSNPLRNFSRPTI